MSTTPPPPEDADDTGLEQSTAEVADLSDLSDLSELAATDALLDRLGARSASEDDLLDPTAAALNSLLSEIDAEAGADSATARLVEVLAGRPLYLDGPSVAAVDEQLIDLTAGEPEPAEAEADIAAKSDEKAVVEKDPEKKDDEGNKPDVVTPVTAITAARSKRWRVAASKVSAPVAAASIAVMVLLGGGLSAAVAGDPMAPLNGVGSVVAKLPGVAKPDNNAGKLEEAQAELALAQQLVSSNPTQARVHLATAKQMLADLPDDDTADLDEQVEFLAAQLPATDLTDPTLVTATPVVEVTTPGTGPTTDAPGPGTPTVPVTATPTTTPTSSDGGGGGGTTAPPTTPEPSTPTSTAPTTTTAPTTSEPASGGGGNSAPPATSTGPTTATSASTPADSSSVASGN